ncbi:TrmH family RNA methyltransferase [Nesterenkonia muleiensis]|uniref:TrmH family RNA methyltransferase n=1 Tax=Nesterenkonia muleiensis TaxID=2282648 RepID=UPI001EE40A4A|nr:RNA methyltransferase [Nesterenkonia muleiensis]
MTDEHVMDNPRAERVKKVAALAGRPGRKKQELFLAEGPQPVREALKLWLAQYDAAPESHDPAADSPGTLPELDALYFTPEALEQHPDVTALLDQARGVLFDPQAELPREARFFLREATADVLTAMSDAEAPQGMVAVCRIPPNEFEGLDSLMVGFTESQVVVHADGSTERGETAHHGSVTLAPVLLGLQDPGNVGTLIRTADAAGAGAVVLGPGTADPWSPKVVRSAVGSHFHLPVFAGIDPEQLTRFARDNGIQVLAADGSGDTALDGLDQEALRTPTLWLLGNEAHGLSPEQKALADTRISIPLYGQAESLNVAVAGALCLYATAMAQRNATAAPDAPLPLLSEDHEGFAPLHRHQEAP